MCLTAEHFCADEMLSRGNNYGDNTQLVARNLFLPIFMDARQAWHQPIGEIYCLGLCDLGDEWVVTEHV